METKKKHSEEVAELNEQIDFVFGSLPSLLQISIQDAIDQLLVVEKKSRLLLEPTITMRITDKILDICFELQNFAKLNSSIVLLCKRRSQHDDVIASLVKKGMSYLPQIQDYDTKMTLIQTLLDMSEGKIYLEANRAHLIRELMQMKESKGDIEGAALASQEIQVEVCNALSSYEKADFLLEQIRLSQAVGDWVRVPLTIQKVNVKVLKEEGYEALIESYIRLCIIQHLHDTDYLSLYYDFERYLSLSQYEEDDSLALSVIKNLCILCILMPFGEEQQLLLRTISDKYGRFWKYIEDYQSFIHMFTQHQLIQWPLPMSSVIQQNSLFQEQASWESLLRKRVIEHNIRVLGEVVTDCTLQRAAELLQVSEQEAEEALASACVEGMTWLRMDRVKRTVCFQQHRAAETVLSDWTQEVKEVMEGLDRIVYLIEKEKMMKEMKFCVCYVKQMASVKDKDGIFQISRSKGKI